MRPTPLLNKDGEFVPVTYMDGTIPLWALGMVDKYVICIRQDTCQPFLFRSEDLDNWSSVEQMLEF